MIHVFVWTPREGAWGHGSMYIERRDATRSRYVSWWPARPDDVALFSDNVGEPSTYSRDVRLEGRGPNRCFQMNIGREYIAEMPMVTAWDASKTRRVYRTLTRNCCTTVAQLLRGPGGAAAHSSWEPITWWGPNDIIEYMTWLNRRFPVCEPLVPPTVPDIT